MVAYCYHRFEHRKKLYSKNNVQFSKQRGGSLFLNPIQKIKKRQGAHSIQNIIKEEEKKLDLVLNFQKDIQSFFHPIISCSSDGRSKKAAYFSFCSLLILRLFLCICVGAYSKYFQNNLSNNKN